MSVPDGLACCLPAISHDIKARNLFIFGGDLIPKNPNQIFEISYIGGS